MNLRTWWSGGPPAKVCTLPHIYSSHSHRHVLTLANNTLENIRICFTWYDTHTLHYVRKNVKIIAIASKLVWRCEQWFSFCTDSDNKLKELGNLLAWLHNFLPLLDKPFQAISMILFFHFRLCGRWCCCCFITNNGCLFLSLVSNQFR